MGHDTLLAREQPLPPMIYTRETHSRIHFVDRPFDIDIKDGIVVCVLRI